MTWILLFFFFQAEDGIRDVAVTGVQTCALPISGWRQAVQKFLNMMPSRVDEYETLLTQNPIWIGRTKDIGYISPEDAIALSMRSEERRVGKECRSRWSPYH